MFRFAFAFPGIPDVGGRDELAIGGMDTNWPLVLPYFDGSVPAGFPSPAEDYLETPLDLHDFLIDNKAATLCWPEGCRFEAQD